MGPTVDVASPPLGAPSRSAAGTTPNASSTTRDRFAREQDRFDLLLQQDERRRVDRGDGVGVLDEVPEMRVLLLADGGLQGRRLLGHLLDLPHPACRETQHAADLLRCGLAALVLDQLTLDAP